MRRVLMDEECDVLIAGSGAEGLKTLNEVTNLALIISDQRMPEMTGVDFLQQAKDVCPAAYRVMLTGYADINATMDAVNKGEIWRYLTKPWDDEQLILLVRDAIRQFNLENENKKLQQIIEKQNQELKEWNDRLKQRVLAQTNRIREKHEELARGNKHLRESFEQTLHAFSCLIELRDKNLKNHSHSTAAISEQVAQNLKLLPKQQKNIRAAALLHGIGKLGIPDNILCKREEDLTASEKIIYNTFTVRGQTAIGPIDDLREAGIILRHLMERYDGKGGPDQLTGDNIPIGSRIIALAEHIDRHLNAGDCGTLEQIIDGCKTQFSKRFDLRLLPIVAKAARAYYSETEQAGLPDSRQELFPKDLSTGMVVLRDVYSGTGLLLLKQGSVLNEESIKSLKRYYDTDTPKQPVLVLKKHD
ncbi:MAG: response regulator [Desulfuromonas sp.]|nr:response regulator [Desulfuromonas sp.]